MVQDFYQLNGSQQVPKRPDGPPQRPPQGPPGVHPQGYPQAHPQGHPTIPPAPPRNMLPVDLRGGPAVQVSDVTQALFTESDMKEELTDYVVFRFEKMAEKDGLDDQGLPKWPSWEKAIRTEDRSISKQAAAHKIRELNLNTRGVIDKKNSLTSPQKRQLDQTLDYLLKQEPDLANFDWTLAQIDHQLRRIEPYHPGGLNHQYVSTRKHRSSTIYPFVSTRSHSRSSNHHHHHHSKKKKKAYERVALTAYFKRTPRRGVDIPRLWKEKKRALEGMYQAPAHNAFPHTQSNHTQFPGPQQQQQHQQPPPPQQHHGGRQPGPPPLRMPDGNQQGPHMPHPDRPMNHNARPSNGHHGHGQNRARHSSSETDSDSDSRRSSSAGSRRGAQTPPSSVSDHRGGGHQHHKNRHHHHHVGPGGSAPNHLRHHTPMNNGRPGNAGHRPNGSPHLLPPRPPAPPYPVSSREGGSVASHIEQVREEAFRRGRLAERTDAKLAEELAFSKAHGRPRPHIVQERSPAAARGRRLYNNRGRGGRGGSDDDMLPRYFSRLGLWDDSEDDDDLELRREYERRVQHGSILEGFDPFELNPPSPSSSSYTYSTDGVRGRRRPPIIEIPERHYPLSSPRLRRRMSYHP